MIKSKVILTTMTMVENKQGEVLVELREKNDWPGINFPGGHVEDNESIEESAIREIKEDCGIDIDNLVCTGHFEWNVPKEGVRHLCILYKTSTFKGKLKSSSEGKVFFINPKDFDKYPQSTDFLLVYKRMKGEY